jgi:hypothetical protein
MPEATALWERGIALRDAPERYAPRFLAAPVGRPQRSQDELSGGWKMLADQNGWDEEKRQAISKGIDQVGNLFESLTAIGRLNYERGRHVANLILTKKAVAIGFANGTSEPQIIPAYLFDNDSSIKWAKSQVAGNGLHFVSVKVTKIRRSEPLPEIPVRAKTKARSKLGRRASSEIIDIIRVLNAEAPFGRLSRKSQTDSVIRYASEKLPERFPQGKGLHPSTVSRYLHQELGP